MTTDDHRAEAERIRERLASTSISHPRAFNVMGEELYALAGLVADMLPKGDPCPCGCRRDVEPEPLVSHDMTECQERINETAANLAAVQYAKGGPVAPSWPAEYTCDCGRAIPCRHCPEPDTVTVTLPRDVVERARARLETAAHWAAEDNQPFAAGGHRQAARALRDALDAANGSQS